MREANIQRRIHLGQLQGLTIPFEGAGGVFGRLLTLLAPELRVAGTLGKETGKGSLQMAQRLLHQHAGNFIEPSVFGLFFQSRERSRRFVITDLFLPLHPRIGAKAQHVVVGKTCAAECPGKRQFLLGRRVEAESVGAFNIISSM